MTASLFLALPRARNRLDDDYTTRRFVPSLPAIVADWTARTTEARRRHAGRLDEGLAYDAHPRARIDLYRADTTAAAPLLVFVHGGFWSAISRAESGFVAPRWTAAGVHVAVLDYGLAPALPLGAITAQAVAGLRWLLARAGELRFDPARVVVAGHSAGAQLAAMTQAVDPPAPVAGLALLSGVFELAPIAQCFVNDTVRISEEDIRTLSPARLPPRRASRLLVAVGEIESVGFHEQSRALAWAWRSMLAEEGLLVLPDHTHFSILDALADPGSAIGVRIAGMLAPAPS